MTSEKERDVPRYPGRAERRFTDRAPLTWLTCSKQNGEKFYESLVISRPTTTYTMFKYTSWCNQSCKNIDILLNQFCWNLNAKMALSTILFRLKRNSRFQLELTLPSTFGWSFKWSKPHQSQLNNMSWPSSYFVLTRRNKLLGII